MTSSVAFVGTLPLAAVLLVGLVAHLRDRRDQRQAAADPDAGTAALP